MNHHFWIALAAGVWCFLVPYLALVLILGVTPWIAMCAGLVASVWASERYRRRSGGDE